MPSILVKVLQGSIYQEMAVARAVEDSVKLSKASLAKYVSESIERMLSAAGGNMK